jgi:thiol-disulfide isomerase/thioredoxin
MMRLHTLVAAFVLASSLASAMELNRPAPEFAIEKGDRSKLSLGSLKGKVVAMVIMSPTCPHCQQLTGTMNGLQQMLGPKGLQVYSVAFGEMKDYMPEYNMKFQPNYPTGVAPRQQIEAFMQHSTMMRFMVPQVILIDRKGIIRQNLDSSHPAFQNPNVMLRAEIEKLLNEGSSPAAAPSTTKKAPAKASKKVS